MKLKEEVTSIVDNVLKVLSTENEHDHELRLKAVEELGVRHVKRWAKELIYLDRPDGNNTERGKGFYEALAIIEKRIEESNKK